MIHLPPFKPEQEVIEYYAFGLTIRSNCAIAGLSPREGPDSANEEAPVTIIFGRLPEWADAMPLVDWQAVFTSSELSEAGQPTLTISQLRDGSHVLYEYADGTSFIISATGVDVWAVWPDTLTLEDTITYFLGPILAVVLRLRGLITLHAAVVEVDGYAVAISGPAQAGKSTTAAAFALNGSNVSTDDVAPIFEKDGHFFIEPTYPRIRLWPDSVVSLLGEHHDLPRLTPTWEKRYLDIQTLNKFSDEPLQLLAIYFLDEREASERAPRIERLTPREAFLWAVASLSSTWRTQDAQVAGFNFADALVANVPTVRVVPHADPARVFELCAVISEHAHALALHMPKLSTDSLHSWHV